MTPSVPTSKSTTQPTSTSAALHRRTRSVLARLLCGAGTASLVAYRHDPARAVPLPAHGVSATGEFVVACAAADVPGLADGGADVRVDLRREATEPGVRILAATAHLLGRVEWLTPTECDDAVAAGVLPESVELVATAAHGTLGVVRAQRILLHDGAGVTPVGFDEALGGLRFGSGARLIFPAAEQEVSAHDVVSTLSVADRHALCDAVLDGCLDGRVVGQVLSERSGGHRCPSTAGRIYCVDVDAHGLTLLRNGAEATTVVYVAFERPVGDELELELQLAALLATIRS